MSDTTNKETNVGFCGIDYRELLLHFFGHDIRKRSSKSLSFASKFLFGPKHNPFEKSIIKFSYFIFYFVKNFKYYFVIQV